MRRGCYNSESWTLQVVISTNASPLNAEVHQYHSVGFDKLLADEEPVRHFTSTRETHCVTESPPSGTEFPGFENFLGDTISPNCPGFIHTDYFRDVMPRFRLSETFNDEEYDPIFKVYLEDPPIPKILSRCIHGRDGNLNAI